MVKNIVLTGFMGTGKSAVGRLVAAELGREFVDMDSLIEEREGRPISQIFAERGEPYFRHLEADLCRELASQQGLIIATGGGALLPEQNLRVMEQSGLVICLDCEPEVLWQRIGQSEDRPMLALRQDESRFARLKTLLEQRAPAYSRIKHHLNVTHLTPEEAAKQLRGWTSILLATSDQVQLEVVDAERTNTLLEEITRWAARRGDISALALVGSWARGTARADSDIDIMLLTPVPSLFRQDDRWLKEIDWNKIGTSVAEWRDAEYGPIWSRHLRLLDDTKIEFGFGLPSWTAVNPIDAGTVQVISNGCRVLFDPQGLFDKLVTHIETLGERMQTITVTHPAGSYPIYLGEGALAQTGQWLAELGYHGRCAVVTHEVVGRYHAAPLLTSLRQAGFEPIYLHIPDGESFKTLATVADLYGRLIEAKLDRRSPIIALGGGVLGDTVGFAAATYLRGVPFVQIPTTLLAMVDASVGGKVGVDLPQGKNLVGVFKQPEMVVVDPGVLTTLPPVEFRAGLAEVVKHGIIGSPTLFDALEERSRGAGGQGGEGEFNLYSLLLTPRFASLLPEAISVKVRVVQADPFEQGRRAVLNLGHTFGHAFECLSNFELRHGEAVALGLACAARLATHLGYCSAATTARIVTLLQKLDLPTQPPAYSPAEVWAAMSTDKKRRGNTLRFILLRAIGDVDIFDNVGREEVEAILERNYGN